MSFRNRAQAGRRLAEALRAFDDADAVVIGLARGGVAVAAEVARALGRPLDAMVVHKIRVPFATEVAMGAVGEDGLEFIDREFLESAAISAADLEEARTRACRQAAQALASIRAERPLLDVSGCVVLLVDDGIATGSTAKVACRMIRQRGARRIVLAVPVGPRGVAREFTGLADEVVVLESPEPFFAVGAHYDLFPQLTDDDVVDLLVRAERRPSPSTPASPSSGPWIDEHVAIAIDTPDGPDELAADLRSPTHPTGAVVFVHGSGSSRHSVRNLHVGTALNDAGHATLLFDLASRAEVARGAAEPTLMDAAERTRAVVRWLHGRLGHDVSVALVGSSTGAAVAIAAACDPAGSVSTVIGRGGRVDLVSGLGPHVAVPVLLIVGGADDLVVTWNRQFAASLTSPHEVAVVEGASHLFAEPGTLDEATDLIVDWCTSRLVRPEVTVTPSV